MGWAKYYEDNVSICIGRMAVKGYIPVNTIPVSAHRFDSCIEGVPVRPTFEHNNDYLEIVEDIRHTPKYKKTLQET